MELRKALTCINILLCLACLEFANADVNSGCPSYGCLPTGSFSLTSGVSSSKGQVKWSTVIDQSDQDDSFRYHGCVSNQQSVVCTTRRGYVALNPLNGSVFWEAQTSTPPFLPVMDIYGDVVGLDTKNLYSILSTGVKQRNINISLLNPEFGLMVASNNLLILTSSSLSTNQIATYGPTGIISGSFPFRGTVDGVNGTFVPSSHPVLKGSRVYVMTHFVPDSTTDSNSGINTVTMQRLYAVDVFARMTERLLLAWYFDLGRDQQQFHGSKYQQSSKEAEYNRQIKASSRNSKIGPKFKKASSTQKTRRPNSERSHDNFDFNEIPPIVVVFNKTVYINNPAYVKTRKNRERILGHQPEQPLESMLWAVRDEGKEAHLVFSQPCWYGPMAVYENFEDEQPPNPRPRDSNLRFESEKSKLNQFNPKENSQFARKINENEPNKNRFQQEEDRVIWILNPSPGMIAGRSTRNGTFIASMYLPELQMWFSSQLSVTRMTKMNSEIPQTNNDILVFGGTDSQQNANLVVVEMDIHNETNNAKLLWSTTLSDPTESKDNDKYSFVSGQIVNFVSSKNDKNTMKGSSDEGVGLIVTVTEQQYSSTSLATSSKIRVFGVY